MKELSAGIIFVRNEQIFLAHATETPRWDIPKGHVEPDELPILTAIRECNEETGFDVKSSDLKDLGKFVYTPKKDLHLFLYTGSEFPDIDKCYCTSYFFKGSRMVYEMDCFNYFDFSDIPHVTGSSMSGVLHQILKSEFNYEPL